MSRTLVFSGAYALLCTAFVIFGIHTSSAQVMQSSNYQIQSDSINFGGGLSTSTNYTLESTAGEVATGEGTSTNYTLKAGYQQMQEIYIALSGSSDVILTPSIPGVSGGSANGSSTVTVITDSPSGYMLTIAAESSPAMRKDSDTIADYAPASDPDFTFSTNAADAHFGYTPEGVDIVQRFRDDGASCNTGLLDTALSCWDGLSTTEETIASNTNANHPDGATTTIRFRVEVGASVVQSPGAYVATTTLTALPL